MSREKITAEWLLGEGACRQQVNLFKRIFPGGLVFSRSNLIKAAKAGMFICWLPTRMFTLVGFVIFESSVPGVYTNGANEIHNAKMVWRQRHHIRAKYRRKFGIK